ncbi:hypothetical protein [Nocardioides pinisoli]|uniref:Uncharacterized protein n=1 Tax=Nocardioides pinisoli TaxID=2950279 RepID=A0ABT1KYP0_9ACTN|nr:hypothetical protein [Nocardioides pinisoli]MCP3422381.1 hypothetical protein [Nocardioides pinisoli]
MEDSQADELAEHRAAPFPPGVEKGSLYGTVEPALIDADIFAWASRYRLDGAQKRSLREAADQLAQSREFFPVDAQPYFERLVRIARRAVAD